MADANVSEVILDINDPQFLITERFYGKPAILSTQVAERFLRRHDHLLRDIATLRSLLPKSFDEANFGSIAMKDSQGKKRPAYLLTRDAFSLLVMGMTGKTAIMWKLRYIEAFNTLEKVALEHGAELAREAGYLAGRQEALSLPVMETERKSGYLEGLKEGQRLAKKQDRLAALEKMAGLLGNVGIKGSQAGTMLKAMLNKMAAPSKEATTLLQKLGITLKDQAGNLKSPVGILGELSGKLKGMGTAQQIAAMKTIVGEEAVAGFAGLIEKGGIGKLQDYIKEIQNAGGACDEMAARMGDTLAGDVRGLGSAFESVRITIGKLFIVSLREG